MKLRELYDLLSTSSAPLKVIGSGTGKVLIHCYSPFTHGAFDDLEVRGFFPEIVCKGDIARVRLVAWASDCEYKNKKLRQEENKG